MADELRNSVRDFEARKRECLDFIEAVEAAASRLANEFPEAAQDASSRLNPEAIRACREKVESAALHILVAGQFKTGKSTLVNALLGENVLPAYTTPCTAVITEVEYAQEPAIELHFKPEIDRESLSGSVDPEIRKHLEKHPDPAPPLRLEMVNQERLERFLAIDEDEEDELRGISTNPVQVCRLYWPLEFCQGDVRIIDSPGLNENGSRDRTTMEYVPHADMILHVLNAQQIYGLPDQQFIKSLEIMGDFPLLFIVNRFDLLGSDREKERVRNYALRKLLPHSGYGEDGVFFASAEMALQGRIQNEPELAEKSGVPDFEKKVADIFASERLKIKLGHVLGAVRDVEIITQDFLPRLQAALNADEEKLEAQSRNQAAIIERLDARIKRIMDSCEAEISIFQERLESELRALFTGFRDNALPRVAEGTDISQFNVSDEHEKAEATGLLIVHIDNAMKEAIAHWQKTTGEPLYNQTLRDIQKEVETELQDFNMLMQILEDSWSLDGVTPTHDRITLDVDGKGMLVAGGLAAGGGLAGIAALALLPARFLGEFAGPVGWLVVALTTALGAALAYWSKGAARKNLKESFIRESRKLIADKSGEWAAEISLDVANRMGENVLMLIRELQRRVEDVKRPVLAAIELLGKNRGNLEQKKKNLDEISKQFSALQAKGKAVADLIG